MTKIINITLMAVAIITLNNLKAQTIPQRNFIEVVSATWAAPDLRAQTNFPLYLQTNPDNIGLQIKIGSSDLSTIYSDDCISLAIESFTNSVPFWVCKRDKETAENVTTTGDKYCQASNPPTWYQTMGGLKKINDSTYDIFSMFMSQRNESNINYVLDVFVVEDSIYYKQKGSSTDIYHRNVMVGFARIPSGILPKSIAAGKRYLFSNRLKIKPFANEKKLSVIVVAYDSLNKKYLNSSNSVSLISETPQICMVTADSANKNNIIWQPTSGKGKVYFEKETNVTNQYVIIDSASSSKPRIFIDKNSNAAIKPESYRLIFKDTTVLIPGLQFGRSNSSATHKTMHLTINKGTGNDWNLIWSSYAGFPVVSYDIYRRFGSGAWSKIGSVSGNVNSYSDINVSGTNVAYKISVIAPSACDPNAWARLSSESNIADQNSLRNFKLCQSDVIIQPNPTDQRLHIQSNSRSGFMKFYEIKDISGRIVGSGSINNLQKDIDVSYLRQGTYFMVIHYDNGLIDKKFIKL